MLASLRVSQLHEGKMPIPTDQYLTPPQIAKLLKVGADQVLTWIKSCELKAVNLSAGDRPRWKVSPIELQRFLESRSNQPIAKNPKRNRIVRATKSYV